jgi:hypothetical protein
MEGRWLASIVIGILLSLFPSAIITAQTTIYAGLSIPKGDFALVDSASGGYARTGISIGIESRRRFYLGSEIGVQVLISYHPVDGDGVLHTHRNIFSGSHIDPGSWTLIWPMASLGYTFSLTHSVKLYIKGLGGAFFGASPDMTVNSGGMAFTQNMALTVSTGYGASTGIRAGRFELNARWLTANPEYDINVQGQGTSTENRSLYSTSTIQVLVGYVL